MFFISKIGLIGRSKNPDKRLKLKVYVKKNYYENVVFYGVVTMDEIHF